MNRWNQTFLDFADRAKSRHKLFLASCPETDYWIRVRRVRAFQSSPSELVQTRIDHNDIYLALLQDPKLSYWQQQITSKGAINFNGLPGVCVELRKVNLALMEWPLTITIKNIEFVLIHSLPDPIEFHFAHVPKSHNADHLLELTTTVIQHSRLTTDSPAAAKTPAERGGDEAAVFGPFFSAAGTRTFHAILPSNTDKLLSVFALWNYFAPQRTNGWGATCAMFLTQATGVHTCKKCHLYGHSSNNCFLNNIEITDLKNSCPAYEEQEQAKADSAKAFLAYRDEVALAKASGAKELPAKPRPPPSHLHARHQQSRPPRNNSSSSSSNDNNNVASFADAARTPPSPKRQQQPQQTSSSSPQQPPPPPSHSPGANVGDDDAQIATTPTESPSGSSSRSSSDNEAAPASATSTATSRSNLSLTSSATKPPGGSSSSSSKKRSNSATGSGMISSSTLLAARSKDNQATRHSRRLEAGSQSDSSGTPPLTQ